MKKIFFLFFLIFSCPYASSQQNRIIIDSALYYKSLQLADNFILIDTHIDLPDWLYDDWFDVSVRSNIGEFDYPRAVEGGLDLAFMSIYTSAKLESTGRSKSKADSMINLVYKVVTEHPDKFALIKSTKDINQINSKDKIYLALGMENGSPVENDLTNLKLFYDKGIRYITLAHYKWNHISDSANDPERKWNGLSPFGKDVVKEMNRLGMMIDISHVSDSAFYDVIKLSTAPVIASHSCCRSFTPGFERNINDEMIKLLAKKGGVVQIAFANFFLREDINKQYINAEKFIESELQKNNISAGTDSAWRFEENYWKQNPLAKANVADVANHIDHIKNLVGVDYVGIGSDFNGVGDHLPVGLENVSKYPNLIYELLKRGYSDEEIQKILGGNLLRVWKEVEKYSQNK